MSKRRIALQQPLHHRLERGRNGGLCLGNRWTCVLENFCNGGARAVPVVGIFSAKKLVQNDSRGKEVASGVHRLSVGVLRTHVSGCADECARLRERGSAKHLCHSEVADLEYAL